MTRAQRGNWYKFCAEPLDKIEHYEEALAEGFKGWCMHHRLEIQPDGALMSAKELIDQGLYYGRPAEELVFMREHDHRSMHKAGANHHLFGKHHSAETCNKIAETLKGRTLSEETRHKIAAAMRGENNPLFGKHHSAAWNILRNRSRKGRLSYCLLYTDCSDYRFVLKEKMRF